MANLNVKFKQILKNLEENVKNKEDLEYIKIQIFNLYNIFFDELTDREEAATQKMTALAGAQAIMQEKIEKLEEDLKNIEKELYIDEDSDFTITCPYCNNEFTVECEEIKDEIECPECNNIIELDWGDETEEHDGCCGHDCAHCDHDDEDM